MYPACLGLEQHSELEFKRMVLAILHSAVRFGQVRDIDLLRWEDPSGARLLLHRSASAMSGAALGFRAESTTRLAGIAPVNYYVAIASVVDEAGEQLTSVAFEPEQNLTLVGREAVTALARITFLTTDVSIHADAAAFASSAASLLDPNDDPDAPPPASYVESGHPWPPRVAAGSFFSYGVFGDPAQAVAKARFSGVVMHAERRISRLTDQAFVVASIAPIMGINATVCLRWVGLERVPRPGEVIAGEALVVGSLPEFDQLEPT